MNQKRITSIVAKENIGKIEKLLSKAGWKERIEILEIMQSFGNNALTGLVVPYLNDKIAKVAKQAVTTLRTLGNYSEDTGKMIEMLESKWKEDEEKEELRKQMEKQKQEELRKQKEEEEMKRAQESKYKEITGKLLKSILMELLFNEIDLTTALRGAMNEALEEHPDVDKAYCINVIQSEGFKDLFILFLADYIRTSNNLLETINNPTMESAVVKATNWKDVLLKDPVSIRAALRQSLED